MQDLPILIRRCASPKLLAAAMAVAATVQLWGVPAFAAPPEEALVRTMRVSTRGVDLGSAAGQSLLRHRIETAAQKVCGAFDQPIATLSADYIACHENSVAEASARLRVMSARAVSQGSEMVADADEEHR